MDSLIHPFSTESLSICCDAPDTAIGLGVQEDRQKSLLNSCRAILTGWRETALQCYVTCSQASAKEGNRQRKNSQHSVRGSKVGGAIGVASDRSGFKPWLPRLLGRRTSGALGCEYYVFSRVVEGNKAFSWSMTGT